MTEGKAKANGTSRASKPRKSAATSKSPRKAGTKAEPGAREAKRVKSLAGGNPQIAKPDGDAPVLAGLKDSERATGEPASRLIDQRIRNLGGWRGETLARMRALILDADPGMTEEWKWNNPVWSHHGIVCTGEAYTKVVKLTFARGASIPDPSRLFNSSLEGNTRRAIDIHEGEEVDAGAFQALVKAAVARNGPPAKKADESKPAGHDVSGDDPLAAYARAQPPALRTMCDRLRALISAALPDATSKVWHGSPVWFLGDNPVVGYNATAKAVNLLFWNGQAFDEAGLQPVGKYRAAQARFSDAAAIDPKAVCRWLKKAKSDVFDSKAFFQRLREGK
jgi:hypothetical protein